MPSGSDGGILSTSPVYRPPRPLLLPTNRRLRHLTGISLRNLRKPAPPPPTTEPIEQPLPTSPRTLRRRSTRTFDLLRWSDTASTRGNIFFSLHHQDVNNNEPFYISEVRDKCMNPDFQALDLNACGGAVSRRNDVVIKIWADWGGGWECVVEDYVQMSGLKFLGRTLEAWGKPLPENAVIWWLSDGCYTAFWDKPPEEEQEVEQLPNGVAMATASYDALLKLNTLSDCISDAANTTASLTTQISTLISAHQEALTLPRAVSEATARSTTISRAIATERNRLLSSQQRLADLKASLASRRAAMAAGRETQEQGASYLTSAQEPLARCRLSLSSTREAIAAQQKRILADLLTIFPITPRSSGSSGASSSPSSQFLIRGLHLPSPPHEDHDDATISAALGYVAQLLYFLSFYLSCPLRYPIKPLGSRSFIRDDISVIQGARTFPLWMKGAVFYRFEYAVFLVNKDVQQLMEWVGIACVDIRYTLANLKAVFETVIEGDILSGGAVAAGVNGSLASLNTPGRAGFGGRNIVATSQGISRTGTPVNGVATGRRIRSLGERNGGRSRSRTPEPSAEQNGRRKEGSLVRPVPVRPLSLLAGRGQ